MKFELNDYNQGVTDEELLEDIQRVQAIIGDEYLSVSKYAEHGKYSETTYRNRFGSWLTVLDNLGLRTSRNEIQMKRITDEALIEDLINVSNILNKKKVTSPEYTELGKYSFPTIKERFGSWKHFTQQAGLEDTGFVKQIDTEDLFQEIEIIWTALGRQPTTTDMKKGISKYSLDTFTRRFGGWRKTLQAFIDYINEEPSNIEDVNYTAKPIPSKQKETKEKIREVTTQIKKTPRTINLRLRFKVLLRDNFSCCYCGSSPAKDTSIELHVDHILPWSKGGETTLENLQTACSRCNLGKGNMSHDQ
jgi:transcriptional regulator of met regulon